jgi:molybdate transport system substrate-binding protein
MKKLILGIFLCILSACKQENASSLNIATASNVQFAIQDIGQAFFKKTGISTHIIPGSSGKLSAQIQAGAPFDVFVSADFKYPQEIYKQGMAINKPEIYAQGKMILWTLRDNIQPSLGILDEDHIRHIAIANPKLAPYGKAAEQILEKHYPKEVIQTKIIYAENISQVNHFLYSGGCDLALTAKSTIHSRNIQKKGKWIEIPNEDYTTIKQAAILIKRESSDMTDQAKLFYQFLFSKEAQNILTTHGYAIP